MRGPIDSKPLVSIVVPIYNAEEYLTECLDSIVNQTYKNLEIILINDGSTDASGKIANEYAKNDDRIKVLHQTNAGVSCARNSALDIATGAWVMFVDADDILPKNSIETMLYTAIESKTQCACGVYQSFSNDIENSLVGVIENSASSHVMDRKDAISVLLYQRVIANAPFSKLYSVESIGKIRFREDISVAEDLLFNYTVIKNLKQVVILENVTYFYRIHSDSVINKSFSMKRMSGLKATGLILADIRSQDLSIRPAINRHFMEAMFILVTQGVKANYPAAYRECKEVIKCYRWSVFKDLQSPMEYRMYALVSIFGPSLAVLAYRYKVLFGRRLKHGR